jgi:hypothetical protein
MNGHAGPLLFDTAAPISYVREPGLVEGARLVGEYFDFAPFEPVHRFTTPLYHADASTVAWDFRSLRVGVLPPGGRIQSLLRDTDAIGILGVEVLERGPVFYAPSQGLMGLAAA